MTDRQRAKRRALEVAERDPVVRALGAAMDAITGDEVWNLLVSVQDERFNLVRHVHRRRWGYGGNPHGRCTPASRPHKRRG